MEGWDRTNLRKLIRLHSYIPTRPYRVGVTMQEHSRTNRPPNDFKNYCEVPE